MAFSPPLLVMLEIPIPDHPGYKVAPGAMVRSSQVAMADETTDHWAILRE